MRYCYADRAGLEGAGAFATGDFAGAPLGTVYALTAAVPPAEPAGCAPDAWEYQGAAISEAERAQLALPPGTELFPVYYNASCAASY